MRCMSGVTTIQRRMCSSPAGSLQIGVIEHRHAVQDGLERDHRRGRGAQKGHDRHFQSHRKRDLTGMKAHGRRHVHIAVGVVDTMETPQQPDAMHGDMLPVDYDIQDKEACGECGPGGNRDPVEAGRNRRPLPTARRPRPAAGRARRSIAVSANVRRRLVGQRRRRGKLRVRAGHSASARTRAASAAAKIAKRSQRLNGDGEAEQAHAVW